MSGLLGSSKSKLPPVPDPLPVPEDLDVQALQKGEAERKRLQRRRGRRSTILSEATLDTQKKTILGE